MLSSTIEACYLLIETCYRVLYRGVLSSIINSSMYYSIIIEYYKLFENYRGVLSSTIGSVFLVGDRDDLWSVL